MKVPKLLGRVHADNFVYLSFLLSSKLCAFLAPLAALLLLGSLSACLSFVPEPLDMDPCFPQVAGISVSPGIPPVLAFQPH